MTYKISLYRIERNRKEGSYKKISLGTTFLTEHSNPYLDDIGRTAASKIGAMDATGFECRGLASTWDHKTLDLPRNWQHRPGKWEPVMFGSIN